MGPRDYYNHYDHHDSHHSCYRARPAASTAIQETAACLSISICPDVSRLSARASSRAPSLWHSDTDGSTDVHFCNATTATRCSAMYTQIQRVSSFFPLLLFDSEPLPAGAPRHGHAPDLMQKSVIVPPHLYMVPELILHIIASATRTSIPTDRFRCVSIIADGKYSFCTRQKL